MDRTPLSRFILFIALSMMMTTLYFQFFIKPKWDKQQRLQQQQQAQKEKEAEKAKLPLIAPRPLKIRQELAKKKDAIVAKNQAKIDKHPRKDVKLGSMDRDSGYFMQVAISSRGASVQSIELNDERYQDIDRDGPLNLVSDEYKDYRTFQTSVAWIDDKLKKQGTSLIEANWKFEKDEEDEAGIINTVVYSFTAPDGTVKITKRFHLRPITVGNLSSREVRDTQTDGYMLDFDITIEHLGGAPVELNYVLQGPVGIPLENKKLTRVFRSVKTGFLGENAEDIEWDELEAEHIESDELTAEDINEKDKDNDIDDWKAGFAYLGVDVKYFTTLIIPRENQINNPYIAVSKAQLLDDPTKDHFSDISVILESKKLDLKNRESIKHSYSLFAGPKREELLTELLAQDTIDLGFFGWISSIMLLILKFINSFIGNYGVAIILLTVVVRGSMYPLSRKQAKGAKKMKELQPKIQELKKKYGDDRQKMAAAQMELFSKHGYNPVAGCLPLLLQMPIFFSLFGALNNAVDLRLAEFLWIKNLASPDALFMFPNNFEVPWLGWNSFNLLPVLTTILFVVQQKMFTPPAMDDQSRMQQKMMMYMSIFFGFMFYSMPAGLCVYFISSSLWGLAERKIVDWQKDDPAPEAPAANDDKPKDPKAPKDPDKPKGFMARLMAAADEAARAKAESDEKKKQSPQNGHRKKKSGSKKNKRSRR